MIKAWNVTREKIEQRNETNYDKSNESFTVSYKAIHSFTFFFTTVETLDKNIFRNYILSTYVVFLGFFLKIQMGTAFVG